MVLIFSYQFSKDIPENFNHSDSESANHTPQTAQMHRIAEAPSSPSPELPVGMVVVEAGEPSNSNQDEAPSHSASMWNIFKLWLSLCIMIIPNVAGYLFQFMRDLSKSYLQKFLCPN